MSVKKEPNKATLLVAVSTNEGSSVQRQTCCIFIQLIQNSGYAVKKHEFSYQIQPDSDNFVHLNLMIMNNTLVNLLFFSFSVTQLITLKSGLFSIAP